LRHLNSHRVKSVLLLHNLDDLGQFELLIVVIAVQVRFQQPPSLLERNVGAEDGKWSWNEIHSDSEVGGGGGGEGVLWQSPPKYEAAGGASGRY
jgi:hypothetical protein